jgi:photosystem II stability/assembly factor-like uncharacterized protein
MRGKLDDQTSSARKPSRGRAKKARRARPPGGKALLRLFAFNGERDPDLNREAIETLVIPNAAVPPSELPKGMTAARAAKRLAEPPTQRRTPASAKSYQTAITKAVVRLDATGRRRPARGRSARATTAAAPPPSAQEWRSIGPDHVSDGQTYGSNRIDVIGRVSAIAIDPGDAKHILVGAAGGGIWESFDTGGTWKPRTDELPSLAIGAVAFDPSNAKRVYAGSGEGNGQVGGAGVYKSTDGGTTWSVEASNPFVGAGFYDLVVDPSAPDTLYAATTIGFWRSTNGGASWSQKRPGVCWDIAVHPSGGNGELLAAFADGLFASTNAGGSFSAVTLPSAPSTGWSRLAVDRVRTSPEVAYVFGAANKVAYLWRRSATTWVKITVPPDADDEGYQQAWYDWCLAATPDNPNQVFVGAINTRRVDLVGGTWKWRNITTQGPDSIHPDQHCLVFSPANSKTIFAGSDGGIYISTNSGQTWKPLNKGLEISEIEYLASDPGTSSWLMAGTQDNGTLRYTGTSKWDHIADGDGGDCGVNQLNPNIVYHSFFYNSETNVVPMERSQNKGDTWTDLLPPQMADALFYPPVEVSGMTVGVAGTDLGVSRDSGQTWSKEPLGLPSGDRSTAMEAVDANTFLIGTRKGRVLRLAWNGTSWQKSSLTSPAPKYISCIVADPSNAQRIWVTSTMVGPGGQVFRSDNAGATWTNCTSGLPAIPINSIAVDPANFKRVWVAGDVGVYQTDDLGSSWASFANGLPNAMAADLLFHKQDRKLFCGTRNRGVWVIDVP